MIRALWSRFTACRRHGHLWGERCYWGDAIRIMGGTHRCERCHKSGRPT